MEGNQVIFEAMRKRITLILNINQSTCFNIFL